MLTFGFKFGVGFPCPNASRTRCREAPNWQSEQMYREMSYISTEHPNASGL